MRVAKRSWRDDINVVVGLVLGPLSGWLADSLGFAGFAKRLVENPFRKSLKRFFDRGFRGFPFSKRFVFRALQTFPFSKRFAFRVLQNFPFSKRFVFRDVQNFSFVKRFWNVFETVHLWLVDSCRSALVRVGETGWGISAQRTFSSLFPGHGS